MVVVSFQDGKITCLLPITLPTSKIRVKRDFEPLATRQEALRAGDLIEWQISYYDENKNLSEASKMLQLAFKEKLITKDALTKLHNYARGIKDGNTFSEKYQIERENTLERFLGEYKLIYRKTPILSKNLDSGCVIEVQLAHKQRAVGFQSMLYIYIPVQNVVSEADGSRLEDRTTNQNEKVVWTPTVADIVEILKAFAISSINHKRDVLGILKKILSGG